MPKLPPVVLTVAMLAVGALVGAEETTPMDVAFTAQCDGSVQRYVVVLPERFASSEIYPLLVALHGHGADRWQFVNDPRDECRAARGAAADHRMIFIAPDYRARTSWMGPKAEADMVQILAEVKNRYRIGKVVLCGGSMGGSAALTFAAGHPDLVDGVVSMNGTANHLEYEGFQAAISESFGGTKAQIPQEYKNRSAEYWPERLTMPVGITTGGRDTLVPPESTLRLGAVLKKIGRHVILRHQPDQGHSTTYDDAKAVLDDVIHAVNKR